MTREQRIELAKKMLAEIDASKEVKEEPRGEPGIRSISILSSEQIRMRELSKKMAKKSHSYTWWSEDLPNEVSFETWEEYVERPEELTREKLKEIRDFLYLPYCMWRNISNYLKKDE